ncbi:zinc finger MYM-type protein 1-like [Bolinopsis microptera]|uniref:zinc finger MYM-type protein 1-like n=1 Tax=Bolinopsis microptera TaxID=2820187 RepID=UPI00307A044B
MSHTHKNTNLKQESLQTGFNNWSNAVGDVKKGLEQHNRCTAHKDAYSKWVQYRQNCNSVTEMLNPSRPVLVKQHREYFAMLISYIRYFCVQGLAYRHEDEHDDEALNRGNWVEFIQVTLETNKDFAHLQSLVREQIGKEMQQSGIYLLMFDESKDNNGHEQISVNFRYCFEGRIKERFIGLIRLADQFTAEHITSLLLPLLDCLKQCGMLVGVTTDGASVLAGKFNGVAVKLKEQYPWIIHIHCTAHR